MVKLDCPYCGQPVLELTYAKKFIFVEGKRYAGAWAWQLGCCGAELWDEPLEWDSEMDAEGQLHSAITDQDGNVILGWIEGAERDQDVT